jgi:hypothetical protein
MRMTGQECRPCAQTGQAAPPMHPPGMPGSTHLDRAAEVSSRCVQQAYSGSGRSISRLGVLQPRSPSSCPAAS